MRRLLRTAAGLLVVMALGTGLVYPLVLTGVAQALFSHQANGSLVTYDGRTVGSSLIGQEFTNAKGQPLAQYFQPRPSASDYDGLASGATNLGPSNPKLLASIASLERAYRAFNHVPADVKVPSDAVTTSSSGLDPDISIANARLQAPRVAAARHLSLATVDRLIAGATEGRIAGVMGEPVVNVLELNVALDRLGPP